VSQTRLLLLGMLQVQGRHGYELMDAVEQQFSAFANLKKASAYYELNRMEAEGLVTARREEQEGRPSRRVFTVTPAGEAAFRQLLQEALRQPGAGVSTADVGLMFLDWLPVGEAAALLAGRIAALRQSLEAVRALPRHRPGSGIYLTMAHLVARLEFEIAWHESLIAQLGVGEEQQS
jgi:DNA-binding PadR family transcriptional regulator